VNASRIELEGLSLVAEAVQVNDGALSFFAVLCVLCYCGFWFGYSSVAKEAPPRASYPPRDPPTWGLKGAALLATAFAALMAIPVRGHLFQGYNEGLFDGYADGVVADALPRGTFVAAVSILFVVILMWASEATSNSPRARDFYGFRPFLVYLGFAVLVLSMGGRLYFLSNLLSLMAFGAVRYGLAFRISQLGFAAMLGAAVLGATGVMRVGGAEVSWVGIVTNIGQEPGLTALSLFSFLDAGVFPVLNAPVFLLSDFVNLLPSSLFPEKVNWLLRPQDFGYTINVPLGGLHLFVSLMVNFGWVGTVGVFVAIGAVLATLRNHVTSWLGCVIYSTVSGWMAFSIFRDPLSVSLVKNVLQVSVLVPLVVLVGLRSARTAVVDPEAGTGPA
jgi:hypothetical protein